MFQQFNTDTLESRFIKNLIYNTPLPLFRTVRKGDWMTIGCSYIYKRDLMRCTKSGFFKEGEVIAEYDITGDYIFGNYYPKFTEKFMSTNSYYDHETHEMLGEYLRCYRDVKGVDLMPFYNCFSGYYSTSFHIKDNLYAEGPDSGYKVALFPINFNTEYTICVDCADTVSLMPLLLNRELPITTVYDTIYVDLSHELLPQSVSYNNTSFRRPFKFMVKTYDYNTDGVLDDIAYAMQMQQNENHLFLALQLPRVNDSSIVVLEGDYTHLEINKILELDDIDKLDENFINRIFLSPLSLMILNDKNKYAFSDRLLEYLLLNAIDKDEPIDNNLTLFQNAMGLQPLIAVTPGVWADIMRYTAYDYYKNNYQKDLRLRFVDMTGYFDKDMERFALKGRYNGN